ncbi:beta-lactamase family protein [Sporosarcina sp. Sa2YVA2]|uniref:Beta-lactamase family protein n=1 Tax=Sporosarcina quadrami TaxID=2762234 RepID=A0ABR8UAI9_9BACL|nr:beta-lactamase family protein [Sporosarcina quadrami]
MNQQKIDKVFEQITKNKRIHEAVLFVENADGDFSCSKGYGGKDVDTPFLMASITKLFTTTCILILKEQGKLSLEDEVTKYFKDDTLSKLHIYKGKEYSMRLTLSNLLFQTSGLPDVFEEGSNNAKKRAIHKDMQFNFDEMITLTKQLKPHFAPNMKKRAHYADVNFDMLGKIIETVTNSTLEEVYQQFIFDPLELKSTYLLKNDCDFVPTFYYKNNVLYRPEFIKSSRASGGGISTARDLMIFIKAFFTGRLFDEKVFHELEFINRLQVSMFPIHYGAGLMSIPLNGFATLFMGKGELVGHSGSTGSFAFYLPSKDLFFVGDVNQISNPALPIRLVMRLAVSLKS